MNRDEFLDALGRSLKGKIDDDEYIRQMDYYRSYFDDEMNSGRSEAEILEELGDPRLIAKTIVTTQGYRGNNDDPGNGNEIYDDGMDTTQKSSGGFFRRIKTIGIIVLILLAVVMFFLAFFRR